MSERMIQGPAVLIKYNTILDARRKELEKITANPTILGDLLYKFRNELRFCKPSEFHEYYELYRPS